MTSTSSRPPTVLEYLMDRDFTPRDEGDLFDRREGSRIIRVVWDGEEDTQVIVLTAHSACIYQATFSPAAPEPVITAAIEAALAQATAEDGDRGMARSARPAWGPGNPGTSPLELTVLRALSDGETPGGIRRQVERMLGRYAGDDDPQLLAAADLHRHQQFTGHPE